MADGTLSTPDLTTFARLDGLGLRATGQFLEPDQALACRILVSEQVPEGRDVLALVCKYALEERLPFDPNHQVLGWQRPPRYPVVTAEDPDLVTCEK